MANNTTNFTLKLKTEGLENAQKGTKQIRDNLEGAQAAAQGLGTSGSRRVASSAAARPTGAAGVSAGVTGGDVEMYNRARGAAGAAGGTARDFADQARGLGGLVRLYATFAANIFAVTAAFNALSRAMDTTNMVKGLDQLGAASGAALGSLSKRLVEATGGAVSLREAMEATVKASSSGISTDNILRLGKVAQQASQALGVDATDALNRLTRGVTKLEPELLDELGIFTKIDPAVQEYAKRIGKATSELTDFERRLAFTTAVLEEGEKKFSSINIETNPYNQLLASLKNVTQTGLELVNTVLGPLVRYLAESPIALGVAIAGFASIILKQAIPAIGQFRAGLQETTDRAQQLAVKKGEEAVAARKTVDAAILASLESTADARVAAVDAAEEKIGNISTESISKQSKAYKLLQTDIRDVTAEQIAAVRARADVVEKEGKTDQASIYREIATAVEEQKNAEEALLVAKQKMGAQYEKDIKGLTAFGLTIRAAELADKKAKMSAIVSNAAYNASLVGMSGATKIARFELEKLGITLTKTEAQILKLKIGLAVLGGALTKLGAILNTVFMVISVATVAFTLLDGVLSKNSKQLSDFNSSVDRTVKAVDTLDDSFAAIARKSPDQYFNSESLAAVATAIMEVSEATAELIKNSEKLEKASSGWDNFIDSIKSMWGGDRKTKFAESLTESTLTALNRLGDSPEAIQAKNKVAGILKIDANATKAEWEKAYKGIYGNTEALKQIDSIMKGVAISFGNAASTAKAFDESLKKTKETYQSFLDKFKVKDELSLLGLEFIDLGVKMEKAFQTPEQAIVELAKIAGDSKALQMFGPEEQANILAYSKQIDTVNKKYQQQKLDLQNLQARRNELEATDTTMKSVDSVTGDVIEVSKNAAEIAAINDQIAKKTAEITESNKEVSKILSKFPDLAKSRLIEGSKNIDAAIGAAFAKATGALQNAVLSVTGDLPGAAQKRYELAVKQLDSESTLINIQLGLIKSNQGIIASNYARMAQEERLAAEAALNAKAEVTGKSVGDLLRDESLPETSRFRKAVAGEEQAAGFKQAVETIGSSAKGAMAFVKGLADKGNQLIKDNYRSLADFSLQVGGLQAQQLSILDKKAAEAFKKRVDEFKEQNKLEQNRLDTESRSIKAAKDLLSVNIQSGQISQKDAVLQEQEIFRREALNKVEKERFNINAQISGLEEAKKADPARAKEIQAEIDFLNTRKKFNDEEAKTSIQANRLSSIDKILKIETEILDREFRLQESAREIQRIKEDTANSLREIELQTARETGKYTEEYLNQLAYNAEIFKINEEAKRRETDLTSKYQFEKAKLTAQLIAEGQKAGFAEQGTPEAERIALEITALNERFATEISGLETVRAARAKSTEEIYKAKTAQDEFNKSIEQLKGLESVFGPIAGALADIAVSLNEAAKNQKKYANEQKRLQDVLDTGALSPEDQIDAEKALAQTKRKSAQQEFSDNAKIAGDAKKLFKEKTFAYKALAAIEKANHIASLAMNAQTIISNLATLPAKIGGGVSQLFSQGGFAGFAGAAAFLGLMASLGFGGGKNVPPPPGFTAEEQQKVQGTGQYYDSQGRLQSTGGGALGDATQKSKTVENAISNMERYDFKNLQYSNKMLKALYEIRDNTKNFATSIIKALPGINLGPTSTSSGNWLFGKTTTTTLDRGLQVVGTIGEIIDRTADIFEYTNTQYKSSGFLGIFGGGTSYGTERTMVQDEGLSRNLSLIFSSAGEAIGQAAQSLGLGSVEDTLQRFRGIDLSEEFGRISLMDLDPSEMTDALNGVVSAAIDSATAEMFPYLVKFQEIGETMGDTILRLANDMNVVTLSLQELGLTLPQLAESGTTASAAMLQRVSDAEDTYKEALAASKEIRTVWMDSGESGYYQEVEGSAEATANLTAAERELQAARQAVADANRGITTNNIELVQSLIDAAGGLENFVEQNRFFAENFLTETERLVPVQKSLTAELDRLGLSSVDTMEEFKELVLGIDFATEEGRNLYQSLMDIAPAFAAVYDSTSKVLDQKDFEKKLYDQETTILQLLNKDQELLNRKRAKEIEELSKYSDAQSAVLVANQEYIYALEDENKIREKLIKQRDKEKKALEDTIKTLQSAIDALQNYKKNLLTSDLTTLTPLQQYQQNKAEFDTLSAVLASSTSTAEEKATAASKLPAAADKLLNSSRTLFASGAQYQADFDRVLGIIDSSTQFLEAQKTDAQKQLDELIASTAFLDSIEDNTKTTADLLKELEDAERKTEEKRVLAVRTAEQWQVDVLGVLKRAYDSPSVTTATEIGNVASDTPTTASVSVDSGSAASSSGTSAVADTGTNATVGNNTVATPVIEAPVIVVTAAVSQPLIASINNLVSSVDGVATEVSGLRTDSAEQTQAIVYSTYDSSDKNALSISTAVVEEKSISTFTASNSPTVDSGRVSTIDR